MLSIEYWDRHLRIAGIANSLLGAFLRWYWRFHWRTVP